MLRNYSQRLRKGGVLRCLAFRRMGESQTLYKKSGNVCVCLIWMYSLETLSPSTTGHGHASSVFTISGICGWNFFLPWNVKCWAVCSVRPYLTRSVCSDSFIVGRRLNPTVLKYALFIDMHIPVIVEASL